MARAADNAQYQKEFDLMKQHAPEMVERKIFSSLHQSAQILHQVLNNIKKDDLVLCVGSFEDVPAEVLTKMGYTVMGVDPVFSLDLHTLRTLNPTFKYPIIFSTSVIEHVQNDEQFIADVCHMLEPGGLYIMTCDFKPDYVTGDLLPATCIRLYTKDRLDYLTKLAESFGCKLTEVPAWDVTPDEMDFEWDGVRYCFMGMSFRKI